jgi:hypothetical protein
MRSEADRPALSKESLDRTELFDRAQERRLPTDDELRAQWALTDAVKARANAVEEEFNARRIKRDALMAESTSMSERCRRKSKEAITDARGDVCVIVGIGFGYMAASMGGFGVVVTVVGAQAVFLAFHVYQAFSWFRMEERALAAERMARDLDEAECEA